MIRPTFDDEQEKPLDPAVEKVRKKLVRFVAINLGLLFLALMAVVGAIVYKTRTEATPQMPITDIPAPAGSVVEGEIALPAGARIVSQALSGDRLSMDVELADGSHAVIVYDLVQRRTIGRYTVTAK